MRRIISALLVLALWLPACANAGNSGDLTGTYTLISIDGNALPYTPSHAGGAPQVLSGTLIVEPGGTFKMSMTYATTPGNSISRDFTGTYSTEKGTLRFHWQGAGVTPATVEGNVITILNEGISFAYQK